MKFKQKIAHGFRCMFPLLLLLVAAGVNAQEGGKIAVVNLERAIMQTDVAKKAIKEFKSQKTISELYKDFEKKSEVYEKAAEKYSKDRAVMSKSKLEEAEIELSSLAEDRQYAASKLQKNEDSLSQQIMQQILPASSQVVENIVREQKIGLLLRSGSGGAVLSADSSYDISNQVTERLNQLIKK